MLLLTRKPPRAALFVFGMTAWGRRALCRHGFGQPISSSEEGDSEASRLAGCRAKHVSWASMPASVRVALPRGYDVCIRQRCSASSGNCVRIAARTRIWPRRSKNRAFCIDESVLSGPIQESASNNWIGRVCLPSSVLPVELSEIPRVVSFYAISPKSGLPDLNPGSGSRGGCLFASNGSDAAPKEFIAAGRCDWIALCQGGEMVECCASGSTWGRGTRERSSSIKKAARRRLVNLERTTGFEPATPTLARSCSTS